MFHPNLGMGGEKVNRRVRYPNDQRSLGGIYLGEREIREQVEEFTSHLVRFSPGYQRTYYEGFSTEIRAHTERFLAGDLLVDASNLASETPQVMKNLI
jgi:hypothetical protein